MDEISWIAAQTMPLPANRLPGSNENEKADVLARAQTVRQQSRRKLHNGTAKAD